MVRVTENQSSYDAYVLQKIHENPNGWIDADGNHCQFAYPAEVFEEADEPPLDTHDNHLTRDVVMNENLPTFWTAPPANRPAWARHFVEVGSSYNDPKNEVKYERKVEIKQEANIEIDVNLPGSSSQPVSSGRLGNSLIDGWKTDAPLGRRRNPFPKDRRTKFSRALKRPAQNADGQGPSKIPAPTSSEAGAFEAARAAAERPTKKNPMTNLSTSSIALAGPYRRTLSSSGSSVLYPKSRPKSRIFRVWNSTLDDSIFKSPVMTKSSATRSDSVVKFSSIFKHCPL